MKYRLWAITALVPLAVSLSACGEGSSESDSVSQAELNAAVRNAERDARREADTQAKLDDLREEINDLEDSNSASDSASQTSSSSGAPLTSGDVGSITYANENAGWTAEVPTGGGWSDGVETQVNDGLLRTTFDGPGDSMLTIDSTPYESPAFGGAPIDSRTAVSHPLFGSAEKIVFQGNSNFDMCDRGLCVDYLMDYASGGFAVLAGAPSNFGQAEAVAQTVMQSLRPS